MYFCPFLSTSPNAFAFNISNVDGSVKITPGRMPQKQTRHCQEAGHQATFLAAIQLRSCAAEVRSWSRVSYADKHLPGVHGICI